MSPFVFPSVLSLNMTMRIPKIMGATERRIVIFRKTLFVFISFPFTNRWYLPNIIIFAGALFCRNYNISSDGDASEWLVLSRLCPDIEPFCPSGSHDRPVRSGPRKDNGACTELLGIGPELAVHPGWNLGDAILIPRLNRVSCGDLLMLNWGGATLRLRSIRPELMAEGRAGRTLHRRLWPPGVSDQRSGNGLECLNPKPGPFCLLIPRYESVHDIFFNHHRMIITNLNTNMRWVG